MFTILHGVGNPPSIIPVPFLPEIIMNHKSIKNGSKTGAKKPGKDYLF